MTTTGGRARVTIPCGEHGRQDHRSGCGRLRAHCVLARRGDGHVTFANESGTLDLWSAPSGGRTRAPVDARFARDTYAPTVSGDGSVLFKVQSYRTTVAVSAAVRRREPTARDVSKRDAVVGSFRRFLGITYGAWRRVVDDAHYPDIAQDAGIIPLDPDKPGGAAFVDRARVGIGGSGALLVAQRQVDRVPLAQGSVR